MSRGRAAVLVVAAATAVLTAGCEDSDGAVVDVSMPEPVITGSEPGTDPEPSGPGTSPSSGPGTAPASSVASSESGGVDGPVVYAAPSEVGEEALGTGVVELVGDCLYLRGEDAETSLTALVWRAGTRWDPASQEVILDDGGARVSMGATISAGGGFHSIGGLSGFISSSAAEAKVSSCAETGSSDAVFVIQHPVEVVPSTSVSGD